MTTRSLKKLMLFGILVTFAFGMAPSMLSAGDSAEPGPPGDVRYAYIPPPFIGDEMHLKLQDQPYGYGVYVVEGTACQVGKSECCIVFNDYLLADEYELLDKGLLGISCTDLKPKYFLGEFTEVPGLGVDLGGDCGDFVIEGVDFIAVGNIRCVEDDSGAATEGWARIILMGWAPKTQ